jgi:hypothetical protein
VELADLVRALPVKVKCPRSNSKLPSSALYMRPAAVLYNPPIITEKGQVMRLHRAQFLALGVTHGLTKQNLILADDDTTRIRVLSQRSISIT